MTRTARSFGPAVGEPPIFVDPRRWGGLIGGVGGLVFIFGYAPPLGTAMSISAEIAGVGLALTVVFGHYIRPTSLGSFRQPSRTGLLLYVCCVAGELAVIAAGSRLLTNLGHGDDLRPPLIAGVVGLHFLPFAWAFDERMFSGMGLAVFVLGSIGLSAGYAGITHAAEAAAVLSGVVMLAFIALHAQGRFAHRNR